ncbi:OPT oligopeptide transporter [Lentinula guzmanii]|uniref:OPT oligopeptide transporter n=1 Tax=Lentinula guzmanii TaxID=2804957 RepID=A0AA38MVH0_9AGAR|nr:OPT oligopeptide transporter [Lentinula guzmanii]
MILASLGKLGLRKNSQSVATTKDSFEDEKTSIKDTAILAVEPYAGIDEKIHLSDVDGESFVGDVYEDARVIDLGDDGKERPIGTTPSQCFLPFSLFSLRTQVDDILVTANDWSLRLISLEDDPTLPVWTLRLWFLSIGLSCFGAVLSEIFAFRPQTVYVSQLFLQTAAFILGKIMEELLPGPLNPRLPTRNNAFWRFINPGRFNIKEHVGIVIMSAAATHGALAINIFAADDLFYNTTMNPAVAIFTLLGSQLLGYGLGGMMRGFLVYPTSMVFPNLIPTVQMFDVLHRGHDNTLQKKRVKFFWTLFIIIFFWQWIPEYFAPMLTGLSIFCLARKNSAWVTRIFGGASGNEGLGLFSLCFGSYLVNDPAPYSSDYLLMQDWNYVGSGGSAYGALFQPIQTQLSLYAGVLICIITFCAVYANNVWNAQNFPFLSQLLFFENGTEYDQTLILNSDFTLNEGKLAVVGLPWYSATQTVTKIGASLSFGATITHIIIWHGQELWSALLAARAGTVEDAHYEKMKVYKEVPFWWYTAMFVASMAIAMATNYTGDSELPWWAFFVCMSFRSRIIPKLTTTTIHKKLLVSLHSFCLLSLLCMLSYGAPCIPNVNCSDDFQFFCVLSFVPGTEDIARMLGAALVPGKPRANMYFTLYAYNSTEQGRSMTRDLKMGQYTKLPPRVTFTMQCLGAVIGGKDLLELLLKCDVAYGLLIMHTALLNYLIMKIVIASNREILLSVQGTNVWSGAAIQSFNSDAISWGALAKQLYSPSGRYGIVPMSILIGLAVPIPFWLLHRKWPKAHFDSVITPMITVEIGYLAGGINSSVFNTFLLCIFSQFFIRKYHPRWFRKYNFLLSAALDGGTEVMVFVYSFAVGGAGGRVIDFPNWALNPAGNPDYCKRLT